MNDIERKIFKGKLLIVGGVAAAMYAIIMTVWRML